MPDQSEMLSSAYSRREDKSAAPVHTLETSAAVIWHRDYTSTPL